MGLIRQSVHPMDAPTDEYANDDMTQHNRIADQYHTLDNSPRGSDLAVASATPPARSASHDDANKRGTAAAAASQLDRSGELSSTSASAPPPTWAQNKSERRLVFADENGGALADITYSSRTHYSKQAGVGALPGAGRACCVIS